MMRRTKKIEMKKGWTVLHRVPQVVVLVFSVVRIIMVKEGMILPLMVVMDLQRITASR